MKKDKIRKKPKEEKILSEERRKENQRFMNYYMGAVAGILAAYVFAYTASIMMEENITFLSAFSLFLSAMSEGEYFFTMNFYAFGGIMAGILTGLVTGFFLQSESSSKYSYDPNAIAGTGGFMDKKQLKNYSLKYVDEDVYVDPLTGKEDENCNPNMILGEGVYRSLNPRITNRNNNILIIGGSGTGKSFGFIKPNILQMNASFVCTDPAGELVRSMGNVLKENGYKIKIFNIVDMKHSNTYNPFNYIREESDVLNMVDCFIQNTTNTIDGKKTVCEFDNVEGSTDLLDSLGDKISDEDYDRLKQTLDEMKEDGCDAAITSVKVEYDENRNPTKVTVGILDESTGIKKYKEYSPR
ncbi:MAG: type IV secretory system conjugative DNA transfer family protein [Eubacteriales bacterium]|nr:type IV secretory system conjugative DNA transfer family protein [Eubacteriales bacterium]